MATSLAAGAKGSPTVFTCKSEDQLGSQEGVSWIISASSLIVVIALMVLSAIFGRWSAPRSAGKEAAQDPEPWVVVSEAATSPGSEQDEGNCMLARKRLVRAEAEGSRAPSESPRGGDRRSLAQRGSGSVNSVKGGQHKTHTLQIRIRKRRLQHRQTPSPIERRIGQWHRQGVTSIVHIHGGGALLLGGR